MILASPVKKAFSAKEKRSTKVEFNFGFQQLKDHYPEAHCTLVFKNPFELLIATMLSAQCTDERVNKVTQVLFKKYPDAKSISKLEISVLEGLVRSTGFYHNKAKNIKQCCQILVRKYKGQVPKTMDQLYELPGVGRKTANVVLGNAYHIPSGVVVDTHVTRLANRMGWVQGLDAVKIEQQLNSMCPKENWVILSHYLIAHGRAICKARSPQCEQCFLQSPCPKLGV